MSLLNTIFPAANENANATACACEQQTAQQPDTKATVRPHYTVNTTEAGWTLNVRMPGVTKTGVAITDEEGVLTIRGERAWKSPEGWTALYRETDDADFALSLQHDGEIDVEKIRAEFADGILTATLPKVEALKPRKIEIN